MAREDGKALMARSVDRHVCLSVSVRTLRLCAEMTSTSSVGMEKVAGRGTRYGGSRHRSSDSVEVGVRMRGPWSLLPREDGLLVALGSLASSAPACPGKPWHCFYKGVVAGVARR
jgi:hypothetical protein